MVISPHQNTGQITIYWLLNKPFENVAEFKYLGRTVTDQNCIHEETDRLNSGNSCYYCLQQV